MVWLGYVFRPLKAQYISGGLEVCKLTGPGKKQLWASG